MKQRPLSDIAGDITTKTHELLALMAELKQAKARERMSGNELIERAAQAAYECRKKILREQGLHYSSWELLPTNEREIQIAGQRAAIAAMRDVEYLPMLHAGKKALFSCSEDPGIDDARECFHAMIDAALNLSQSAHPTDSSTSHRSRSE